MPPINILAPEELVIVPLLVILPSTSIRLASERVPVTVKSFTATEDETEILSPDSIVTSLAKVGSQEQSQTEVLVQFPELMLFISIDVFPIVK